MVQREQADAQAREVVLLHLRDEAFGEVVDADASGQVANRMPTISSTAFIKGELNPV